MHIFHEEFESFLLDHGLIILETNQFAVEINIQVASLVVRFQITNLASILIFRHDVNCFLFL